MTYRRQRGVTLISLLIGMLLSSLCILAMLGLYRNLVQTAVVATHDANQDGQIAAALLTTQLKLQSAGFGSGINTDVYLNDGKLYWRYRPAPDNEQDYECRSLVERTEQGNRLLTLQKAECKASDSYANLPWDEHDLANLGAADSKGNLQEHWIKFALDTASCATPYGFGGSARRRQITICLLHDKNGKCESNQPLSPPDQKIQVCLSNIPE